MYIGIQKKFMKDKSWDPKQNSNRLDCLFLYLFSFLVPIIPGRGANFHQNSKRIPEQFHGYLLFFPREFFEEFLYLQKKNNYSHTYIMSNVNVHFQNGTATYQNLAMFYSVIWPYCQLYQSMNMWLFLSLFW